MYSILLDESGGKARPNHKSKLVEKFWGSKLEETHEKLYDLPHRSWRAGVPGSGAAQGHKRES